MNIIHLLVVADTVCVAFLLWTLWGVLGRRVEIAKTVSIKNDGDPYRYGVIVQKTGEIMIRKPDDTFCDPIAPAKSDQ